LTKAQFDAEAFNNYIDGLGVNGEVTNFTGDANSISETSVYYMVGSVSANLPDTSTGFIVETYIYNSNLNNIQRASSVFASSYKIYWRNFSAGAWGAWKEITFLDDVVPISGNTSNPMTGDLKGNGLNTILRFKDIDLGDPTVNQPTFIDFVSSTDPSQSDYSSRIIRNSGVNSEFRITNRGSGNIIFDAVGGGIVGISTSSDSFTFNGNKGTLLGDPTNPQDAVNLQTLESRTGGGAVRWAKVTNGTVSPVIERGKGIVSITKVSNTYTATLETPLGVNRDVMILFCPNDANANRSCNYIRDNSTASSIEFKLVDGSGGANDFPTFYITITELL
jgi:hypothetical protein